MAEAAAAVEPPALLDGLWGAAGPPALPPEARESDCLGGGALPPSLEAEAAVGAVRLDGSLTGRVGDLGFGLTKPAEGDRSSALGFFPDDTVDFEGAAFGVVSLTAAGVDFFSGAFAVSLAGLFGCLLASGDLNGFDVVLADVEIGAAALAGGLLAGIELLGLSLTSVAPLRRLGLPLTSLATVGSADVSLVLVSSSSTILSGFGPGVISGVSVPLFGDELAGVLRAGDSGMGSLATFVLNEVAFLAMFSAKTSLFSDPGAGVVLSVSLLNLLLEADTESRLFSRTSPIRPSFSTATKFVRTLDSGREDGVGEPGSRQSLR